MHTGNLSARSRITVGVLCSLWFAIALYCILLAPQSAMALPCSNSNISITRISAPKFYIDTRNPGIYGSYVEYKITNNGLSEIADLWVKLVGFSGGLISLASLEDGVSHVGRLQPGSSNSKYVYFYLYASDPGNGAIPTQSHSVALYTTKPSLGSSFCSDSFSYSDIIDTIDANANKVTSVSFSPNPPELGGQLSVTVQGDTGTVGGAGIIAISPAVLSSWPASSFELQDVSIALLDSATPPNIQTENDTLYLSGQPSPTRSYVLTYIFGVKAPVASSTTIYPINYINSGNPVKHTDTSGFGAITPISPTTSNIYISSLLTTESSAATCFSSGIGGATTVSATITNNGTSSVTLDDIVVSLPNVTVNSSSSTFAGVAISDPEITNLGSLATWRGLFTIPAGTSQVLAFTVNVPNVDGVYDLSAIAHIDETQIDSTLNTADNSPVSGYTCVGAAPTATPAATATSTPTNTATFTPTQSPTASPTETPTASPTAILTSTPTSSPTPNPTETPTLTPTSTPTTTPTQTSTPTPTETPTQTPTQTPTPIDSDSDNDGILNSIEGDGDVDGDGISNDLDLDSDNDGIADIIEGGGSDVDGDGASDSVIDSDGDGLTDPYDPDSGGVVLPIPDTDGDGVPNYKDRDSDGDGVPDIVERGGSDINNDGGVDSQTDSDGDGLANDFDPTNGGTNLQPPDTDGDGRADYLDLDSDGDGISDRIESGSNGEFREPSGADADLDGIDDAYDSGAGGVPPSVPDSDGDGAADFRDLDSDGDGFDDNREAFDLDGNGEVDVSPSGADLNNNGIDDSYEAFGRPSDIKLSWRESAASLDCDKVDLRRRINTIRVLTFTLRNRAELFAGRAKGCGASSRPGQLDQVRAIARQLSEQLTRACGGQLYDCPLGQCTVSSIRSDKNRMRSLARGLARLQKGIKLDAIKWCGVAPKSPGERDSRKNTDDYLVDLLGAIGRLPNSVTRCS